MRLFQITFATILRRNAWAACLIAVSLLPFLLPWISSATENPVLMQPARAHAAWVLLWVCSLLWGLYSAAKQGEANAQTGIGEYFQSAGVSATRQLFEIWLAVTCYITLLALAAAAVCMLGAAPSLPDERSLWLLTNLEYIALFLLVISPLLALAIALASRFGGIVGFAIPLGLALYGLYGVGYLENMLKLEENPFLHAIWLVSPHYHFADLTARLEHKWGSMPAPDFAKVVLYFTGIFAIWTGLSRLCFRTRASS
jgi:hypothetical protein